MTPTPRTRTTPFLPSLSLTLPREHPRRPQRLSPGLFTLLAGSMLLPVSAQADTTRLIDKMEQQISAMQAEVKALKKKQAIENAQLRAQLKQQREMLEADPYQPSRFGHPSLAAQSAPPFINPDSPAASLLSRYDHKTSQQVDLFGFTTDDLLPSRTASTPYGEITATPPAHPDLYQPLRRGQLQIGGIRLTLGGYFETAGFWRSRTIGSDIASSYASIPWANQSAYYMSSYHQSERQSRFSMLAEGMITHRLEADGYVEVDFQSAGSSSNSRQSSSYTLRPRVLYGEVKDRADGLYFLGGQSWSLITLFNKGMFARDEQTPLVIEAQYLPGFNWTRTTQVRVLKTFGAEERYGLAMSLENPSAVIAGKYPGSATHQVTDRVNGTGINNPDTYYATDPAPDVIAKFGADPGWGHYEISGLMRFFRTRSTWAHLGANNAVLSSHGQNKTVIGGGGGGGMVLPLIDKRLYFQASGLVGRGIGRYGSAGLPDYTFTAGGSPAPLPEASLLVGVYGMPIPTLTLYAYAGAEKVLGRRSFDLNGTPYGYGNRAYNMSGCHTELSTACAASGNIQTIAQATTGAWYTAAHGDYGKLLVGAQYSHTYLQAFSGVGGKPHTDDDMVFFSLRYMPFN